MPTTLRVVLLGLAVAACGGGGGRTPPPAEPTPPTPTEAEDVAAPEPPPPPPDPLADAKQAAAAAKEPKDRVRTLAELGLGQWQLGCTLDGGEVDGLCIAPRAAEASCLDDGRPRWVASPRGALGDEARETFGKVVQLWADGEVLGDAKKKSDDDHALAALVAKVMIARIDADLEAMLAVEAPQLDGDGKKGMSKASMKAFKEWVKALTETSTRAREGYAKLAADRTLMALVPDYKVAIYARTAQVFARFSDAIAGLAIPATVRDLGPDGVDAYCDALLEQSKPLASMAAKGFQGCVQVAKKEKIAGPWSEVCEREAPPPPPDKKKSKKK